MFAERVTDLEFEIPDDEPVETCPYCERPFRRSEYLTYHVGKVHAETCTDEERAAFDEEREDEEFELFTFHVKAAVTVFMVYFMFTFIYALVWAG